MSGTAGQVINGRQQFIDGNGLPLAGGTVYHYVPGTLTPIVTYQDIAHTVPNTFPIALDASGMANIFATTQTIRQIVKNLAGTTIWDRETTLVGTVLNAGATGYALLQTETVAQAGALVQTYLMTSTGGTTARSLANHLADMLTPFDFGAVGDGVTNDTAAMQAAITASNLYIPNNTFLVNTTLNVPANRKLWAEPGGKILYTGTGACLNIQGSGVEIDFLTLDGNRTGSTYTSGSNGISAIAASWAARYTGMRIRSCFITNFDDNGIRADYLEDAEILNSKFSRLGRAGILLISPKSVRVNGNRVLNVTPGSGGVSPLLNAYGIALTRNATDDLALNPLPADCDVFGNMVDGVPTWEGLDTHGGANCKFVLNTVRNCLIGIGVVPSDGPTVFANASECLVALNYIDGTNTAGPMTGNGILVVPASTGGGTSVGMKVIGNILRDCGTDDPATLPDGSAIHLGNCTGYQVSDNHLYNSNWSAIDLDDTMAGGTVTGNQIVEVTTISGNDTGIRAKSTTVLANIDNNVFYGSFTALDILAAPAANYGIYYGAGNTYQGGTTRYSATTAGRLVGGTALAGPIAWIDFDGTTATERASFGVSVLTKNATGDYTVSFTNPAFVGAVCAVITSSERSCVVDVINTTDVSFRTLNAAGAATDATIINVVIFGR